MQLKCKMFKIENIRTTNGFDLRLTFEMDYSKQDRIDLEDYNAQPYGGLELKQEIPPDDDRFKALIPEEMTGMFEISQKMGKNKHIYIRFETAYDKASAIEFQKMYDDTVIMEIRQIDTELPTGEDENGSIYEDEE